MCLLLVGLTQRIRLDLHFGRRCDTFVLQFLKARLWILVFPLISPVHYVVEERVCDWLGSGVIHGAGVRTQSAGLIWPLPLLVAM